MDNICPSASESVIDETIGQEQARIGHFACRRCDVRCPAMSATTVATHVELPVSVPLRRPQVGGSPFRVADLDQGKGFSGHLHRRKPTPPLPPPPPGPKGPRPPHP